MTPIPVDKTLVANFQIEPDELKQLIKDKILAEWSVYEDCTFEFDHSFTVTRFVGAYRQNVI